LHFREDVVKGAENGYMLRLLYVYIGAFGCMLMPNYSFKYVK